MAYEVQTQQCKILNGYRPHDGRQLAAGLPFARLSKHLRLGVRLSQLKGM